MKLQVFNPSKKLKAAYQRLHIDRKKIELFKGNIKTAFKDITIADQKKESEEHYKTIVRDFLLDTYYKGNHSINTQGRNDLVIHNGSNATSPVGIIIETKQPSNKAEMISAKNPNSKSFQQLITYFLKERFENKNLEIKHLIISNIYEWYIFDASDFERYFYDNKKIKDSYLNWKNGDSLMSKTDWFYKEVLFPHIDENLESIPCTYFNLKDYQAVIENDPDSYREEDDEALLDLYKILSPEHLLKKQVVNDSNSLNKQFYAELLHILGLEEVKEGSKKTIKRCAKPNEGSILENTLAKLKTKARDLSETELYDTALELTITWLNRILFLKLLEGQLIKYNNNPDFAFLNYKKIDEYDILEELFFEVLAVNYKDRPDSIQKLYANIPYLNSSLFEETELERKYFGIGLLKDRLDIPIYSNTVLNPDNKRDKIKGSSKRTLEYLFEFLDAYDFSDDTKGKIKEQSKTIINASVLGLIFEKINGYKDGSFFTPSFITMYMCRESIRRAVVQKFNDTYGWNCEEFIDLRNEIKSIKKIEANEVLNTLRICDPAVGSGHFLVSALNEMISIKQDLKILIDKTGEDFSEYSIEIENDELIIKDEKGNPYSYNVSNKESRRVQETLFNEKQTIIENCLFGVDINPKSVMICRLRLWIELLKNAYYKPSDFPKVSDFREVQHLELQTLPNIDINIKCGNSLISRFEVKDSVFESVPNFQTRLKEYTTWVQVYKGERDKSAKAQLVKKIDQFKSEFKLRDKRTDKVQNEIDKVTMEILKSKNPMFPLTDTEKAKVKDYEAKLEKLTQEKKDIESNPIYQNAFEWRFEFPEILDENGGFIGFDVVIGNPPYINAKELTEKYEAQRKFLSNSEYTTLYQKWDLYIPFIERGLKISNNGILSVIIPYPYINQTYAKLSRESIIRENTTLEIVDLSGTKIFDEATVNNCIVTVCNKKPLSDYPVYIKRLNNQKIYEYQKIDSDKIITQNFIFDLESNNQIKFKVPVKKLEELVFISKGMVLNADEKIAKGQFVKDDLISEKESKTNSKKYIEAKNIDSYKVNKIRFLEWNTNRVPSLISRPTFQELYENPKILINKIGALKATIDFDNLYCDQTIRIAVLWTDLKKVQNNSIKNSVTRYSDFSRSQLEKYSESFDLKYIVSILNSKMGNYLLNSVRGTGNIDINPEYLKNIEIPDITPTKQKPFIKLVTQILSLKKSNPEADISGLEAEIDRMVYELYGLTEEEVKVVEGK